MTVEEIHEHMEEYNGWCTTCKEVTNYGGVEPDAREYECEQCGEHTVYGMEEAAGVMMVVPITEAHPGIVRELTKMGTIDQDFDPEDEGD